MINLFIALFWLVLGLGLIFIPGFQVWTIRGTDFIKPGGISIGWLAVALAAYNLLRWWLTSRQQRPHWTPEQDPSSAPREYNPEFDFNKDQPERK